MQLALGQRGFGKHPAAERTPRISCGAPAATVAATLHRPLATVVCVLIPWPSPPPAAASAQHDGLAQAAGAGAGPGTRAAGLDTTRQTAPD